MHQQIEFEFIFASCAHWRCLIVLFFLASFWRWTLQTSIHCSVHDCLHRIGHTNVRSLENCGNIFYRHKTQHHRIDSESVGRQEYFWLSRNCNFRFMQRILRFFRCIYEEKEHVHRDTHTHNTMWHQFNGKANVR